MVVHDPGDAQRGKRTSTTQDRHDPSKEEALVGTNRPNRKEIVAKLNEKDKNSEIPVDTAAAVAAAAEAID